MEDNREAQLAEKKLASTNQTQTTRQASFPALRVIIVGVYGADDAHSIPIFPHCLNLRDSLKQGLEWGKFGSTFKVRDISLAVQ
jgi:hypothetical protein